MRTLHLAYSYASADERHREAMEKHLSLLTYSGRLSTSALLATRSPCSTADAERLERADIVAFLISPDFMGSAFWRGAELASLLDRRAAANRPVVPILLRQCDYRGAPFDRFEPLPKGGKEISRFRRRDDGWCGIAVGLREIVERLDGKAGAPTADEAARPRPVVRRHVERSRSKPQSAFCPGSGFVLVRAVARAAPRAGSRIYRRLAAGDPVMMVERHKRWVLVLFGGKDRALQWGWLLARSIHPAHARAAPAGGRSPDVPRGRGA